MGRMLYCLFMKHTQTIQYVFQKQAQEVFDIFTGLFGIRIAFFSSSGKELKVGQSKPLCKYCRLLRENLDYESTCLKLDNKMLQEARSGRKLVSYTCHGGMIEAVMPVVMEDDIIGFIMIGQFRSSECLLKRGVQKKAQEYGVLTELEESYYEMVYHEPDQVERILKLFEFLVDYILQKHMIELYGSSTVEPLMRFMEINMEENLNLNEGAKLLMQSRSSLSHKFKNKTGMSFKQYQIKLKLDKAEDLFLKRPAMSIKEVAVRLGYDDQYYFSRLYKKHRGCSPSEAKKRIMEQGKVPDDNHGE